MARKDDLIYEENKTKVTVFLEGKESASATKLVNKFKEYDLLHQQAKAFKAKVAELTAAANEKKAEYEVKLRETIDTYFDASIDSAKTRVIETQSFIIKMAKEETVARESSSIDYEQAFMDLVELMNIPTDVVNEVINKNTEIELTLPKAKLYAPIDKHEANTKAISESFEKVKNFFKSIKDNLVSFYKSITAKFKSFDSKLKELEKKYLV